MVTQRAAAVAGGRAEGFPTVARVRLRPAVYIIARAPRWPPDRYIPSPSERDVNKRLAIKNKSGEEYIRRENHHVQHHVCTEERTSSSSSGAGDRWCRRLPEKITGL